MRKVPLKSFSLCLTQIMALAPESRSAISCLASVVFVKFPATRQSNAAWIESEAGDDQTGLSGRQVIARASGPEAGLIGPDIAGLLSVRSELMKSAFLMHPLDASYVRRSWHMLARLWGSALSDALIERLIQPIRPYVHSRFRVARHESMIVVCPLTSRQMMTLPSNLVVDKLLRACELAYSEGAGVISLGAYSAIASNQGLELLGRARIGLTTGRAYTVYSIMQQVRQYLSEDSVLAIVGAEGAIGRCCSRLARQHKLILVNRHNLEDVYQADVVVTATSRISGVIDPTRLKQNAVVIDAAKPSDLCNRTRRADVQVLGGGQIRIPGSTDFGIHFDLPRNTVYACMAEAFILGMSGHKGDFCIGSEISPQKVDQIGKLGDSLGFEVV